jgi:hypothetical protein
MRGADMTPVDVAIAVGVLCVLLACIALAIAVLRQREMPPEKPRRIEVIVRSVFAGDVVQEEHIFVEGTSEEPVELTLDLDAQEQVREYL